MDGKKKEVSPRKGRRSTKNVAKDITEPTIIDDTVTVEVVEVALAEVADVENVLPKKRGRKPKGGKIVDIGAAQIEKEIIKPNVILHLKCSTTDLHSNGNHESDFSKVSIDSYDRDEPVYHVIGNSHTDPTNRVMFGENNIPSIAEVEQASGSTDNCDNISSIDTPPTYNAKHNHLNNGNSAHATKELWKKLKSLEHLLHMNSVPDSNAACFWCTYDFDNPPVYIPKMFLKNTYHVYGCFCSPECAVAHLMNENIDSSSKFDRFSLLNTIYNQVYGYSKNIKPAPDPHYLLAKFFGNLSITEYRSLLRSDRLFLVVDKPLTRILPELHEDNDEFIINNKIIPTSANYQVKRKLKTSLNKNTNENFGIFSAT